MKHIVEILAFTATDEYIADHSLVAAPAQYAKTLDGLLKGFRGFSVQDPTQAYYILLWDSFASYEAAGKREDFAAFRGTLKSTVKANVVVRHIEFDEDTTVAFSAPVTEYAVVKPKEGTTQADVDAVIAAMNEAAPTLPGAHSPAGWGPVRQTPEVYVLVAGWDSVQAHLNALKLPPINKLAPKLVEIAELTLVHMALQPLC